MKVILPLNSGFDFQIIFLNIEHVCWPFLGEKIDCFSNESYFYYLTLVNLLSSVHNVK